MSKSAANPLVLVFDVNETLIDIESLSPLFLRVFGDARILREWFGQSILYSMSLTLSGLYQDFFTLGQGLFEMLATIHKVKIDPSDLEALRNGLMTMPAHADVKPGLERLREAGFRLITLTNSPPGHGGTTPLENAGLAGFFERQFSVQTARAFKPAQVLYHMVAQELNVSSSDCCMVAAHVWDLIGAQSAGFAAGLITRPGNARLPIAGLPRPDVVAPDLPSLAAEMIKLWRS